jgi:hypothetical protein
MWKYWLGVIKGTGCERGMGNREIQGIFCEEATRSPRRTANGSAKRELGR